MYGSNIHAYCCVQSLLTLGIAGSNIALVQPPTEVSLLDQLTTGIDVSPGERQLHPFEWCTSDKYINRPPHCPTELRQHSHVWRFSVWHLFQEFYLPYQLSLPQRQSNSLCHWLDNKLTIQLHKMIPKPYMLTGKMPFIAHAGLGLLSDNSWQLSQIKGDSDHLVTGAGRGGVCLCKTDRTPTDSFDSVKETGALAKLCTFCHWFTRPIASEHSGAMAHYSLYHLRNMTPLLFGKLCYHATFFHQ